MHLSVASLVLFSLPALLVSAQNCGQGIGNCAAGLCCSSAGWCGDTPAHCTLPGCQASFSDSCTPGVGPPGESTRSIPRPKIGNVPYGSLIYNCTKPGLVALTYDDGPWQYTSQLVDILDKAGIKATFFMNGNNGGRGRMDDPASPWPALMKKMYATGHQLASHSYIHFDLTTLSRADQENELIFNEMSFRNVFGFFPTYYRCPFLACDVASGSLPLLGELGYHVIDLNIDTKDWMYQTPENVQQAKDLFSAGMSTNPSVNSYISLTHDTYLTTVNNLTFHMIDTLRARGYKPVTVGECLGDPEANWYRNAGAAVPSSQPSSTTTRPSTTLTSSVITTRNGTTSTTTTVSTTQNPTSATTVLTTSSTTGVTTTVRPTSAATTTSTRSSTRSRSSRTTRSRKSKAPKPTRTTRSRKAATTTRGEYATKPTDGSDSDDEACD